jgi:hypothetical protein
VSAVRAEPCQVHLSVFPAQYIFLELINCISTCLFRILSENQSSFTFQILPLQL